MDHVKRIGLFAIVVAFTSIAAAYAVNSLVGVIRIGGTFSPSNNPGNVEMSPSTINIDLGLVGESEGSKIFDNIAKLVVKNTSRIMVKVSGTPGSMVPDNISNLSLIISGEMILKRGEKQYTIQMPCLYSIGGCYRILVLIPGYDAPMDIEPGEYSVSLRISWTAQGKGEARVSLELQIIEAR